MAKKTTKPDPKVKKPKTQKLETKLESLKPVKKTFPQILKSVFFPSKEEYTPQKQLKEVQLGLYFLAFSNAILAFLVSPYIIIDALIMALIGFNLDKRAKKYVVIMLIIYTFSTIIINYLSGKVPFNLVSILLVVFCIQLGRLVFFKKN